MSSIVSVAALVRYLKSKVDIDPKLQGLIIKGEISNFVAHRSGHYYFTLKDETSRISCVMFASKAMRCPMKLENGMNVLVRGSVSIYESSGQCQIYVDTIELDGLGLIYQKIEELKRKLSLEGLFDESNKKHLPLYPMRIGVISALEGAATQDVFTTIKRRWPVATINFYPSLVQGASAAQNLINRLNEADNDDNDVILIVRGGGSIEDLFCFYDESLLRTVYALKTPIVSGVGHETDTTLIDYVSDMRAPTPTAAAELVTPDYREVVASLQLIKNQLIRNTQNIHAIKNNQLLLLRNHPYIKNPRLKIIDKQHDLVLYEQKLEHFLEIYKRRRNEYLYLKERFLRQSTFINDEKYRLKELNDALITSLNKLRDNKKEQLVRNVALLDAYSPLKTLSKGYAITYSNDKLIKSVDEVNINSEIEVTYIDGRIKAVVSDKEKLK